MLVSLRFACLAVLRMSGRAAVLARSDQATDAEILIAPAIPVLIPQMARDSPNSRHCELAYLFAGLYVHSMTVIVNSVVRSGSRAALNRIFAATVTVGGLSNRVPISQLCTSSAPLGWRCR